MKVRIEKSVCVITPTIGENCLTDAIESVRKQTYGNITHLIVADGPNYAMIKTHAKYAHYADDRTIFTSTPYNTGRDGFYGHRIYAAYPHLVNADYICFLDADNWYEPDHVASLVKKIETDGLDWVYSLRNVYLDKNKFLAKDCCESIGKWPIWFTRKEIPQYLVDTSSYCFKREFLINVCNYWHSGWGGDRRFLYIITQQLGHTNYDTTGQHTLNYVLPDMDKAYGGDLEFFAKGNVDVEKFYGGYPWLK